MHERLRARVSEIVAAGDGETVGTETFLPLVRLESGLRLGLAASGSWVAHPPEGTLVPFEGPARGHFFEAIEVRRAEFDERLGAAGEAAGIAADLLLAAFPSVELVAAVLATEAPYYTRLALGWLVPSELRELRSAIVAVAENRLMTEAVRSLARRLIVSE